MYKHARVTQRSRGSEASSRSGLRLVAASLAVLLGSAPVIGFGSSAFASEESPQLPQVDQAYVAPDGVVHYKYDPAERPGAQLEVEQGNVLRDGVGCGFDASGGGAGTSGYLTVVDEVSFDPGSCVRTLSVAVYPTGKVPDLVSRELAPQAGMVYDTATESAGISASKAGPAALASSWYQKLSAWVGDPVLIHVTETKIGRTWSSSGTWSNSYEWGWYTPTGWYRTSQGTTGNSTTGDTRGNYENWAFGAQNEQTNTYHTKTMLTTSSSGTWNWSYTMNKTGEGANSLLSYHYAFG